MGRDQLPTTATPPPPSALGRPDLEQHQMSSRPITSTPRQHSPPSDLPNSQASSSAPSSKSSRNGLPTSPNLRPKRGDGASSSHKTTKLDHLPSKTSSSSPDSHSKNQQSISGKSAESMTPLTPSRQNASQFNPSKDVPSSPRVEQGAFSGWYQPYLQSKVENEKELGWGHKDSHFGEYHDGEDDGDVEVHRGCIVPYEGPEDDSEKENADQGLEKVLRGSSSDDEDTFTVASPWSEVASSLSSLSNSKSQGMKSKSRINSRASLSPVFNPQKKLNQTSSHRGQPSSISNSKTHPRDRLSPHHPELASSFSNRPETPPTPSSPKSYGGPSEIEIAPAQHSSSDATPPPTPIFNLAKLPDEEAVVVVSSRIKKGEDSDPRLSVETGGRANGSSSLDLPSRDPNQMGPPRVPRSKSLTSQSTPRRINHSRGQSSFEASVPPPPPPPFHTQRRTMAASLSKRMPNLTFSRIGQAMGIGQAEYAPVVAKNQPHGALMEGQAPLLAFSSLQNSSNLTSTPTNSGGGDLKSFGVPSGTAKTHLVMPSSAKSKRKSPIKSPNSPRIPKGAKTRARPQAPSNFSSPPSSSSSSSSLTNGKVFKDKMENKVEDNSSTLVSHPEAVLLSKTSASHGDQYGFLSGTRESSGFKPTKALPSFSSSSLSKTKVLSPSLLGPAFDDGGSLVVEPSSVQSKPVDARVGLGMGFPRTQTHPLKSLGPLNGISSYFNNVGTGTLPTGILENSTGMGLTRSLLNARRRANVSSLLPSALPSPDQSEDTDPIELQEAEEVTAVEAEVSVVAPRTNLSSALKEDQSIHSAKSKSRSITTPKIISAFNQTLLDIKNREVKAGSPPTPDLCKSYHSPAEVPSIIVTPPPAAVSPSAARRLYATLNRDGTVFSSFESVTMDSPKVENQMNSTHEAIGSNFLSLESTSTASLDSVISDRGPGEDAFASPASLGLWLGTSPSSLGSFDTPSLDQSDGASQPEILEIPLAVLESRIEADTKGFNAAAIQIDSLLSDFLRMGDKHAKITLTSKKLVALLNDIFVGKPNVPQIPTLFFQRVEPLLLHQHNPSSDFGDDRSDNKNSNQTNYLLPQLWLQEENEKMLEKILEHVVTGILALLQDDRSPWEIPGMLSKLVVIMKESLSSPRDSEKDLGQPFFDEVLNHTSTSQSRKPKNLDASVLLMSLIQTHLSGFFNRGEEARGRSCCLNIPPPRRGNKKKWAALTAAKAVQDAAREKVLKMAAKGIISEEEYRRRERKRAAQGDLKDSFAHVNIVRFVGELFAVELLSLGDLQAWLHRLFFDTVHPEVPSAFELEAGCALLITVGLPLEKRAQKEVSAAFRDGNKKSNSSTPYSERSLMDYAPATPPPLSSEGNGLGIQNDGNGSVVAASQLSRSDSAPTSHWINHNHSPSSIKRSPLLTPRHDRWARTRSAPSSPDPPPRSTIRDGSDSVMNSLSSRSSVGLSTSTASSGQMSQDSLSTGLRDVTNTIDSNSGLLKTSSQVHSEAKHTLDSCTSRIFELLLHEDIIVDAKDWIKELLALRQRNWRRIH